MKFKRITKIIFIACLSLYMTAVQANNISRAEYQKRVQNLNTVIDMRINDKVSDEIELIVEKRRRESQVILGRTALYFPLIEQKIREMELPDELKYLAAIESSLRPDATSRAGAAGLWQFMKNTAQLMGLRIDRNVDERRDVEKSTEKALLYLKMLKEKYGNWTMALAAYNCGPGTISRAINRSGGSNNYWEIAKYLPYETQEFIPRFIAMSYLMNYYYIHDLTPTEPEVELRYTSSIRVYNKVSFPALSKKINLDLRIIKILNPSFIREHIPQSSDGKYKLVLPQRAMDLYAQAYNIDLNASEYAFDVLSLQQIGKESTGSVDNYIMKNTLLNIKPFYAVESLNNQHSLIGLVLTDMKSGTNKSQTFKNYRLGRMESLANVAQKHQVSLKDLLRWNGIRPEDELPLNAVVKIALN
jgi:hypothetical protein